jgi:hypothetical protein
MLKTVKKVSNKSPSKSLIDELPGGVKENLASGEEVIRYLKTFEVVVDPDYILLTNLRLIYFNEKHFGRYAFKSIPFQKLLQIRAHRGALLWGDISFKGEDGTVITLERVDRNDLEGFLDAVEITYNSIAVEPISIKHDRGLVGKATWEFDKPKELIVRQQSSDQPKPSEDPLNQLRIRFIRGEISEEEYKAKLRVLQEK